MSPPLSLPLSLFFFYSHTLPLSQTFSCWQSRSSRKSPSLTRYCTVLYFTLRISRHCCHTMGCGACGNCFYVISYLALPLHWFPFLYLYSSPTFLTLTPELITPLPAPPVLLPHRPEQRCSERHGHNRKDFPVHSLLLHRTSHHLPPIPLQPLL
jgi:hypothetical protein